MSAIRQLRAQEPEAIPEAGSEAPTAASASDRENPIELLRGAIALLKTSGGDLPDQSQVATLLVEARDALQRANVVGHAIEECQGHLLESRFDKAFEALDGALLAYPDDPSLVTRRGAVQARQEAFRAASAVQMALEEADWFVAQDRLDLAVQHLHDTAKDLPDQMALISRLEELESQVPAWQQKRDVQTALGRAATLEQTAQWQAALTVLEEAMQGYPDSRELGDAARRVQDQLVDHERQKKLARRLELIGQRIAAQQWRQAFTLLETARKEFPGATELEALRSDVDAGLRRSECDAVGAEVRQWLADGELEQAEQILRRARKTLGSEPALEVLREELESEKNYRAELRTAQILFGKRQFREAESTLSQLLSQDRPEAQALLTAVREARAHTEEESFFDGGRERALELIQQNQFAQAEELLRNLLALFPGNPLLERDLKAAQGGLDQRASESAPAAGDPEIEVLAPEIPKPPGSTRERTIRAGAAAGEGARESAPSRFRRTAVVGAASLALVSAAGAAWKLSHSAAPVSRPAAAPAAKQIPAEPPLPVVQQAASAPVPVSVPEPPRSSPPSSQSPAAGRVAPKEAAPDAAPARVTALRQFVSPNTPQAPGQASAIPLPPATEPVITAQTVPALPAALLRSNVTIPAPAAQRPAEPSAAPVLPSGGRIQQALLVSRVMPAYPDLARRSGVFGIVRLEAVVDERGAVRDVKVVSGPPVLAVAAKDAVLKWKYTPGTLNDHPIATNVVIQINFGAQSK